MNIDAAFQGSLFANDFLCDAITRLPDWQAIDDAAVGTLEAALREIFEHFPIAGSPNESQTEDDLIWPVLAALGWMASLRQQNLSTSGMDGRAGRLAVRGRGREESCQPLSPGVAALRARSRGGGVQVSIGFEY